jgi:hypothetical protein
MELGHVYREPVMVETRLTELGLSQELLLNSVGIGQLAFSSCTDNHPPLIRGVWAWGETVRGLREALIPLGWERSDLNNYSLVVNAEGTVAIAVATGDEGTGLEFASPTTKSKKGPSTASAVTENQDQLLLFPDLEPSIIQLAGEKAMTYILLIHLTGDRVRSELSLPTSIVEGRVNGWSERILLRDVDLDGGPVEPVVYDVPDIDVAIKRRA